VRRRLARLCGVAAVAAGLLAPPARGEATLPKAAAPLPRPAERMAGAADPAMLATWRQRWERSIIGDASNRSCATEMGEEIGWLISPFLKGYYYGYMATRELRWIGLLVDWADCWIRRGVKEPDGSIGWPKAGAAGTDVDDLDSYYADSLLGEAMALEPLVLMSAEILRDPELKARFGDKARAYIDLARSIFEKWDRRGAWRPSGEGMISVVLPFGIDPKTGGWTAGYADRNSFSIGFSHPNNKANMVATWLLAMFDATGDAVYRDRAEKWFRVMKSRMHLQPEGVFQIWNYWEPGGAWDYRYYVKKKHWVGVHPNPGYYAIDVEAIVKAYQHGVVFTRPDIDRLIGTALVDSRPWPALAPYDDAIRARFEAGVKPDGWAELAVVPWYLSVQRH